MASGGDRAIDIVISAKEMAQAVIDKVSGAVSGLGIKVDSVGNSINAATDQMMGAFDHPIDSVKGLASAVGEKLASALAGLGPIGGIAAAGLGAIVGAAVAVTGAVFALAGVAATAGDGIKDFHEQTGIGVGNIGKWEFAVKAAGGQLTDLTGILKKVEISAAADQGGKFAAALKDIGINASEFKKMDSEQQLKALAEGFQRGAKSGNDMAAAVAIMGKQGADSIPLLRNLTDDLLKSGEKLGVQWTTDSANAADTYKVSLASIETALGNVGTQIGVAVLPAVASMLEQFASSPAFIDGVTSVVNGLAHGLGYAVEVIGHLIQGVMDVYAPFAAWQSFLSSLMMSAIKGAIGGISDFIGWFGKFDIVSSIVKTLGGVFTSLKDEVVHAVTTVLGWLEKIPGVGPAIKAAMDSAASTFTTVTASAHSVGTATDAVGGALLRVGQASTSATAALDKQNKAHNRGVVEADAHSKATDDVAKKITELAAALADAEKHHLSIAEVEKLHGNEIKDLTLKAKELGLAMPVAMQQWADAIANEKFTAALDKANAAALKIEQNLTDSRIKASMKVTETQIKDAETAFKATEGITKQYAELYMTAAEKAVMAAEIQRDKSLAALEPLKTSAPAVYAQMADRVGVIYGAMVTTAQASVHKQIGFVTGMLSDLPGVVSAALQGGGDIGKVMGNFLGGELFNVESGPLGKVMTEGVSKMCNKIGGEFGGKLANALTNAIPMIGTLVGPAISALAGKLSEIFSGNTTKKSREEFAASMNLTLDGLYTKLQAMGATGQALANQALNVIGKHDEAGNKKWMAEVSSFLDSTKQKEEDLAKASAEAFQTAQTSIGSALGKVITGTIGTQDEFDRLSRIALNTFNTLVKSGVPPIEAMKQIGASVDVLIDSLDKSGLHGSAAYNQLARWRTLTAENAPLLDQVGSLNELMSMTTTLGGMNAEAFADMQQQGAEAYGKLLKAGFTEAEARAQIKPLLLEEIRLNKEKGFAIDDATQNIIAQGLATGDLSLENESMTDVFREGISALILAIGGELPAAWKKAAAAATTMSTTGQTAMDALGAHGVSAIGSIAYAIGQLPSDINIDVNGKWHAPDVPGDNGGETHPAFATEAFVRSPTVAMIGDVAGGELVLKPSTVARVRQAAFDAGAQSGGPAIDYAALARMVGASVKAAMNGLVVESHTNIKLNEMTVARSVTRNQPRVLREAGVPV